MSLRACGEIVFEFLGVIGLLFMCCLFLSRLILPIGRACEARRNCAPGLNRPVLALLVHLEQGLVLSKKENPQPDEQREDPGAPAPRLAGPTVRED